MEGHLKLHVHPFLRKDIHTVQYYIIPLCIDMLSFVLQSPSPPHLFNTNLFEYL